MKDLVIGDIHFGIKTNSPVWLEHQVNFFEKQIFPIIKKNNYNFTSNINKYIVL